MFLLIHKSVKVYIVFLTLFFNYLNGFSQTKVTGHIFAEIVESVGTSSKINNFIKVDKEAQTQKVNLGEIAICNGQNSYSSLVFHAQILNNKEKEILFFEGFNYFDYTDNENHNHGIQRYKLIGNSFKETWDKPDELNVLSFQVTIAYN